MILLSQELGLIDMADRGARKADLKPLWEEVEILIKEPFLTKFFREHELPHLGEGLKLRLSKWISFLNEYYHRCITIYNPLFNAIIQAVKANPIMRSQSVHEMEISQQFLKNFLTYSDSFIINDEETAQYIISISLILGRYPGMLRERIKTALSMLEDRLNVDMLSNLFRTLFLNYEIPEVLIKNLHRPEENISKAIMHIQWGKNIRHLEGLPLPISRKESWYFIYHPPTGLYAQDHILLRLLVWSKLLKGNLEHKLLLEKMLRSSSIYKNSIHDFIRDLEFWKQAFLIFIKSEDIIPGCLNVKDTMDFLEFKKLTERSTYSLKGKSPLRVYHESMCWHEEFGYLTARRKLQNKNFSWAPKHPMTTTQMEYYGIEYSFKEICSARELMEESESLNHCAFNYLNQCYAGKTTLFRVHQVEKTCAIPVLTIEIQQKKLVQLRGFNNRQASLWELDFVRLWCEENGIVCKEEDLG